MLANVSTKDVKGKEDVLTLSYSRTDGGQSTEYCRYENTTAAAEEVVQRIGAPTPEECRGNVRASVDQTLEPLVTSSIGVVLRRDP